MFSNQTKQTLTKEQLHHVAKRCFGLLDVRGCGALSKGELLEFSKFVNESVMFNHTLMKQDQKTGVTSDNFDMTGFNRMYDSFQKVVVVVKKSDMEKIINKLGEDVYDGVSQTGPDGTRYEDRVEFKEIWSYFLKRFSDDGVLYKPFEVFQPSADELEGKPESSPTLEIKVTDGLNS